jgi:hypothetical protein
MKLLTTKDKVKLFHGNCKDSRIRKALLITGDDKRSLVHKVIASNGRFDPDSINVRRYAKALLKAKSTKVRVSVRDAYK